MTTCKTPDARATRPHGVAFAVLLSREAQPEVWLRAVAPMATALVLVVAFGVLGVRGAMTVAHRALGDGFGAGFVGVLLALAAVVLAIVIGVSLAQPLSGWALDGIVRAQERELGVAPVARPPFLATLLRSARQRD